MVSKKKFYTICRAFHKYSDCQGFNLFSFEVNANYKEDFEINKSKELLSILESFSLDIMRLRHHDSYDFEVICFFSAESLSKSEIKKAISAYIDEESLSIEKLPLLVEETANKLFLCSNAIPLKLDLESF